jgi:hypothetical protein
MKSEQELRELLADLFLYDELHPDNPFTAGMASMLSYVLDVPDRCGTAGCTHDHNALRDNGLAIIQRRATKERAQRAAREKAQRQ